jgi:lipid II isoglutaminyl synthase (glutamine-hydrolysing)
LEAYEQPVNSPNKRAINPSFITFRGMMPSFLIYIIFGIFSQQPFDIVLIGCFCLHMKFFLTHLYPKEMNIYGDMGNIIVLKYRLQKMGYEVLYQTLNQNSELPAQTDLYFIGGGQDKEQEIIYQDLLAHKQFLEKDIQRGVGLLAICGGYQLLGKSFITGNGKVVEGLNIFPVETKSPDSTVKSRCIGNLIIQCHIPEIKNTKIVGFENHGGQTYFLEKNKFNKLQELAYPLGKVLLGFGNNSVEKLEGCVLNSAIGTYLHGSCLPKNPQLADWLIYKSLLAKAKHEKNEEILLELDSKFLNIDDKISLAVQESLIKRFLG